MKNAHWIFLLCLGGCFKLAASTSEPELTVPAFAAQVKEAAENYISYGRIDDQMRWAPGMCAMPRPASAHLSKSQDDATHGRKLYSILAKDRRGYLRTLGGMQDAAVGQVIVKESWEPKEVHNAPGPFEYRRATPRPQKDGSRADLSGLDADHFNPYLRGADGKMFEASQKHGLFIMIKMAPTTPGTDLGWVYATTDAKGRLVEAGAVASCMECHQQAKTDRLFGTGAADYTP